MLPISNEITIFNIDDNDNPTTPHEMKNTTLACSLCFIQEKNCVCYFRTSPWRSSYGISKWKKDYSKKLFTISSAN